jgi:hypothetical protein
MPEHRTATGRHDNADKLRKVGQEMRRIGNDFLRLVGCKTGRVEPFPLNGQHGVDEEAVAARGGNPSGRRVRTGDQAKLLKI